MNGGIARSKTTARPGSSTSQPMIRSVSGNSFSADPLIRARLCLPLVTTAAAAPSPNKAVATTAAGSSLSSRIEIEQVSTVTNSQQAAGIGRGKPRGEREAVDAAGTAQAEHRYAADVGAQPEPWPMRASRLGVAMPVVETVTTPSIWSGVSPAFSMAAVAASMNSCSAASR